MTRRVTDDQTSASVRQLADFICETRRRELPAEVVHQSKRCLLDFLGLAIGAAEHPAVRIARRQFDRLGGAPQALSLGTQSCYRVTDAAFLNGIAAHAFDLDDTHLPTILHATTPAYAAALALAQWQSSSGLDLLTAHAVGYEVGARLALALFPRHYAVGWHMTGTAGTVTAAAASASVLRLDPGATLRCLGIAAAQAAGHREQFGTMVKPLHAGHAASAGVLAALVAQDGFTSAPDALQGKRGMLAVMGGEPASPQLTHALGERWEISHNGTKPYACGVVTHPAIDGIRALRDRIGAARDEVERIEFDVHPLVVELTGKSDPRSGLEGKFSVYFACAIAYLHGSARESDFTDDNVVRADVRSLMARIHVYPVNSMKVTQAAARLITASGQTESITIDAVTGAPENPMDDEELEAKFLDLAAPALGPQRARQLARVVWTIDQAAELDELVDLAVNSKTPAQQP